MDKLQVFLDMDGVVADFTRGFKNVFPEWIEPSNKKGIITDEMWNHLHTTHPTFWADLPPMEDAYDLINGLESLELGDFIMLSALPNPKYGTVQNVLSGKSLWVAENIGYNNAIFCMRSHKKDYANPDSLLIDDSPLNVEEFRKKGGLAILHKSASSTIEELKSIVDSRGRKES